MNKLTKKQINKIIESARFYYKNYPQPGAFINVEITCSFDSLSLIDANEAVFIQYDGHSLGELTLEIVIDEQGTHNSILEKDELVSALTEKAQEFFNSKLWDLNLAAKEEIIINRENKEVNGINELIKGYGLMFARINSGAAKKSIGAQDFRIIPRPWGLCELPVPCDFYDRRFYFDDISSGKGVEFISNYVKGLTC